GLLSATSRVNTGVTRMPKRMYRPTPTRMRLRKNGMRQPHVRNWSPAKRLNARTARFARNRPQGTPNCGHDATNPRFVLDRVHSIDISTDPPHSPPTPTP